MRAFADTSFLCSHFYSDSHSQRSDAYFQDRASAVEVSTLVLFEFRQSLRLQGFQHRRDQTIGKPIQEIRRIFVDLQTDLAQNRLRVATVDWPTVHNLAETLSAKHTATAGHRFADILHVATALQMGVREFLTFDDGQRALAEEEGLEVPL